jgi:hypothetical protein
MHASISSPLFTLLKNEKVKSAFNLQRNTAGIVRSVNLKPSYADRILITWYKNKIDKVAKKLQKFNLLWGFGGLIAGRTVHDIDLKTQLASVTADIKTRKKMIRNVTNMGEHWSSRQYYFLDPRERGLYRVYTSPSCWPGKGFSSHQMLSLVYLYRMYSVLVIPRSTHRVAMATFWRTTSHHDGKISPPWYGWGGARPIPYDHKQSCGMPSNWKGRYPPYSPLPLYVLCGLSCQGLIVVRARIFKR